MEKKEDTRVVVPLVFEQFTTVVYEIVQAFRNTISRPLMDNNFQVVSR